MRTVTVVLALGGLAGLIVDAGAVAPAERLHDPYFWATFVALCTGVGIGCYVRRNDRRISGRDADGAGVAVALRARAGFGPRR